MTRESFKALIKKYEKFFVPGLLLSGVILDFVTFRTLNITTTLGILAIYATIAALCILYANIYDGRATPPTFPPLKWLRVISPLIVQFTFGALLSMSLIFYWYSGSVSASWPILIAAIVLMASNEVFRHFLMRPIPQMSLFTFNIFSLCTIALPYLTDSIDTWTFVVGGVVSLLISLIVAAALIRNAPQIRAKRIRLTLAILTVFGAMNYLYFANIIPPIPLSIREAGIYYNVTPENGNYTLEGEPESWLQSLIPGQTLRSGVSDRTYALTSIFAPGNLNTQIFHRWEFFNPTTKTWTTTDRLGFQIRGGRDGGYRGYSYKTRIQPGKWRVTVETPSGKILGRIPFTMLPAKE